MPHTIVLSLSLSKAALAGVQRQMRLPCNSGRRSAVGAGMALVAGPVAAAGLARRRLRIQASTQ